MNLRHEAGLAVLAELLTDGDRERPELLRFWQEFAAKQVLPGSGLAPLPYPLATLLVRFAHLRPEVRDRLVRGLVRMWPDLQGALEDADDSDAEVHVDSPSMATSAVARQASAADTRRETAFAAAPLIPGLTVRKDWFDRMLDWIAAVFPFQA